MYGMTIEIVVIPLQLDAKTLRERGDAVRSKRRYGFSIVAISLYFSCCNYGAKKDIGQAVGKMAGDISG